MTPNDQKQGSNETEVGAGTTRRRLLYGVVVVLAGATFLACSGKSPKDSNAAASPEPFGRASVRMEQNATDKDAEFVFEVVGGGDGLAALAVTAPDGRKVIDFSAADSARFGIRQFRFESPEPGDIAGLKAAYPAGDYTFAGTSTSGILFHGVSKLSHGLPAVASFVKPAAEAEDVPTKGLVVVWKAPAGMSQCILTIEQEESGVDIVSHLPASTTRFAVPDGFLLPGTEYKLAIGTVGPDGNSSFVETSFVTAK